MSSWSRSTTVSTSSASLARLSWMTKTLGSSTNAWPPCGYATSTSTSQIVVACEPVANPTYPCSSIASFGGDPSRMILFGQSAGGGSTEFYSYAWTADPIISGFIVESGAGASLSPGGSASANVSSPWFTISQRVGCGGVEAGEKTLECMRAKPWKEILGVMDKRTVIPDKVSGAFTPVADGKVVFTDVAKRRKEGNFIKAVRILLCAASFSSYYLSIHSLETARLS
jgi:Carboxylesterase family